MDRKDIGQPDIDFSTKTESPAQKKDELSFIDFSEAQQKKDNSRSSRILAELENMKISDFANAGTKAEEPEKPSEHEEPEISEAAEVSYATEEAYEPDGAEASAASDAAEASDTTEEAYEAEISDAPDAPEAPEQEILEPEAPEPEAPAYDVPKEEASCAEENVAYDRISEEAAEITDIVPTLSERVEDTHEESFADDDVELNIVNWSSDPRSVSKQKTSAYTKERAESFSRESTVSSVHGEGTDEKQVDNAMYDGVDLSFCDFRHITPRRVSVPHSPHGSSDHTRDQKPLSKKKIIKACKEAAITLGIFLLVFVLMVTFNIYVHRKNQVFGTSMEPTLHEGDTVYTTMLPYIFGEPCIGDIVIVDRSLDDSSGYFHMFSQVIKRNTIATWIIGEENITLDTCWIKRVVGTPGDTLRFNDGKFYRNGEVVVEDYIKDKKIMSYPNDTTFVVPDGYVYVMGDNRNASKDSRDPSVGPIPVYQIIGKMWKTS